MEEVAFTNVKKREILKKFWKEKINVIRRKEIKGEERGEKEK